MFKIKTNQHEDIIQSITLKYKNSFFRNAKDFNKSKSISVNKTEVESWRRDYLWLNVTQTAMNIKLTLNLTSNFILFDSFVWIFQILSTFEKLCCFDWYHQVFCNHFNFKFSKWFEYFLSTRFHWWKYHFQSRFSFALS